MEANSEIVRTIYPLNQTKVFSHEEALELIPLLQLISAKTKRELSVLNSQLSFFKSNSDKAGAFRKRLIHLFRAGLTKCVDSGRFLYPYARSESQEKKVIIFGSIPKISSSCTKKLSHPFNQNLQCNQCH